MHSLHSASNKTRISPCHAIGIDILIASVEDLATNPEYGYAQMSLEAVNDEIKELDSFEGIVTPLMMRARLVLEMRRELLFNEFFECVA